MHSTNRRFIPIARPLMDQREVDAAGRAILSGWITQGPEVAAFEREFAAFVGAPHACAVSNCTTALHLALLAVGVKPGDEVVTVSHTFIATPNAIRYCGAIPVFVDIEPDTFNMDPSRVERALTPRTRAILAVHQLGMPCDLRALLPIAQRHGLPLIEDAACAIGSEIERDGCWDKIGRPHGQIACFSFHPRKVAATGDGGMLTTASEAYDAQFRLLRQHSMSVADATRHGSREVIFESYPSLGFNYRMTDIQAAVGRVQLERLSDIVARRRALADRYHTLLGDSGVTLPAEPPWARSNWQSFCVRLPRSADQRTVMQRLLDRGVATRRAVMCCHLEPAYHLEPWTCGSGEGRCGCPKPHCDRLRESEAAQRQAILIPLFPQMSDEDQDYVVQELLQALQPT